MYLFWLKFHALNMFHEYINAVIYIQITMLKIKWFKQSFLISISNKILLNISIYFVRTSCIKKKGMG